MVVEYLLVSQYNNHMDGVEEAYLHSFSQIHLDILCTELDIQNLLGPDLLLELHKSQTRLHSLYTLHAKNFKNDLFFISLTIRM